MEIELERLPRVLEENGRDATNVGRLRPAFSLCASLLALENAENFQGQHSPEGISWKPRKSAKANHPLLQKSGRLKAAALGRGDGRFEATDHGFTLRIALPYARIHDQGGVIYRAAGKGRATIRIPARPYLGPSPKLLDTFADVIGNAVGAKILP